MRHALVAGVPLSVFWRSTIGEVIAMMEAAHERRRLDAATQVDAIIRALGAAFGSGGGDPLEGLVERPERVPISTDEVRRLRFWRAT